MTETVDGKPKITLVNCFDRDTERFESFMLGEIVRNQQEYILGNVPQGSQGEVVHFTDPGRYRHFIYVEFGEGVTRKLGTFALGELENLTDMLTSQVPLTIA